MQTILKRSFGYSAAIRFIGKRSLSKLIRFTYPIYR